MQIFRSKYIVKLLLMMDISVRTICKITGYSKPRVYQIKKAK